MDIFKGVGKTWLLLRWAGFDGQLSKFTSSMPTIGIDFKMKTVMVNKKRVKVQVVSIYIFNFLFIFIILNS